MVTIGGLCNGLDPKFDLIKVAKPYFELLSTDEIVKPGKSLPNQVKKTFTNIIAIPEKFNRLVNGLESGEIKLQPAKSFEEKLFNQQLASTNRIVNAIVSVGLLLTGTQFVLAELYNFGYGLLTIAAILIIRLWTKGNTQNARSRRRARRAGPGFNKPRFHP